MKLQVGSKLALAIIGVQPLNFAGVKGWVVSFKWALRVVCTRWHTSATWKHKYPSCWRRWAGDTLLQTNPTAGAASSAVVEMKNERGRNRAEVVVVSMLVG